MGEELNQEQIWDKVARPWKKHRGKPLKEVMEFLKEQDRKIRKEKGRKKILDLGCGTGRNFMKLKNVEFYGVDFSEKMIKLAEKYAKKEKINVILKRAKANNLPFKSEFFDSAIFIASLHNIETAEKREKALKELKRVLKKGSEALISVWNKNQPRFKNKQKEVFIGWKIKNNNYKRFYYLYDIEELEDLLEKIGFEIIKSWENENIFVKVRKI